MLLERCGHVRFITKQFYGQDTDGWAKQMCKELVSSMF
jgi:hypothetical protein